VFEWCGSCAGVGAAGVVVAAAVVVSVAAAVADVCDERVRVFA